MDILELLLPKTKKALQNAPKNALQKKTGREALAEALGPAGQYIFGSDRQKEAAQAGLELGSWAVPFGKGKNIISKFALPGLFSGAVRAASEDNPTLSSVATGAIGGGAGASLTGGIFDVLGKAGVKLTKNVPENLMNKVFKEGVKQTKSAVGKGMTLGQEALRRGVKGSEEGILQQSIDKMDELEALVQNTLSQSNKTVAINDLLKTTQPLIDSYKKAGNLTAAKSLEDRIMNIWQQNGENIPVSVANEIKRTLYNEVGEKYGAMGSEGVEGIKSVARGIKESIAKQVPQIKEINQDLGFWGRARDAMTDKLARSSRNQSMGLRDATLFAGGMAGAPFTGGASVLPFLTTLTQTPKTQTLMANALSKTGNTISQSGIPDFLSKIIGATGSQVGSRINSSVVPGPSEINSGNNNTNYNNPTHNNASISQQVPGMPKDGEISPEGQWRFDATKGDWVPNSDAQGGTGKKGISEEQIGMAMLADLASTGGKNIPELATIAQFLVDKKKPLTATQQTLATNVESANRSIDKVEKMLSEDPGLVLKSVVPGLGGRLLGASQYTTASKEIADIIARMRTGAVINDEEMQNYLSKLPQPGDSPEDIQYKIGELRFIFASLRDRLENQSGANELGLPTGF